MNETITVHLEEDDVLTYFIGESSIIGQQIEVDPDRLVRWHRVFAEFDEVQWEIREHVVAARGDGAEQNTGTAEHPYSPDFGVGCADCNKPLSVHRTMYDASLANLRMFGEFPIIDNPNYSAAARGDALRREAIASTALDGQTIAIIPREDGEQA